MRQVVSPRIYFAIYLLALAVASFHLYRTPIYDMDSVQYMGNALLMEDSNIVRVHAHVYSELKSAVPASALQSLLGRDPGAPADQNESRRLRAEDPGHFAEFLPFFAIRPLYNQALFLVGKTGIGLVRSAVLISVVSYAHMGILLFVWVSRRASLALSLIISLLSMTGKSDGLPSST